MTPPPEALGDVARGDAKDAEGSGKGAKREVDGGVSCLRAYTHRQAAAPQRMGRNKGSGFRVRNRLPIVLSLATRENKEMQMGNLAMVAGRGGTRRRRASLSG